MTEENNCVKGDGKSRKKKKDKCNSNWPSRVYLLFRRLLLALNSAQIPQESFFELKRGQSVMRSFVARKTVAAAADNGALIKRGTDVAKNEFTRWQSPAKRMETSRHTHTHTYTCTETELVCMCECVEPGVYSNLACAGVETVEWR